MEYYYGNSLSVLCQISREHDELVEELTPIHLEQIRSTKSFQQYIESKGGEANSLLTDDESLCSIIPSMVSFITEYRKRFHGAFETLLKLQDYVSSSTLRKDKFDLLMLFIQPREKQSEYLETVRCLLKLLKKQSIESYLQDIFNIWDSRDDWKSAFSHFRDKINAAFLNTFASEGHENINNDRDREMAKTLSQILTLFFQ